jgi:hypothetical protein
MTKMTGNPFYAKWPESRWIPAPDNVREKMPLTGREYFNNFSSDKLKKSEIIKSNSILEICMAKGVQGKVNKVEIEKAFDRIFSPENLAKAGELSRKLRISSIKDLSDPFNIIKEDPKTWRITSS